MAVCRRRRRAGGCDGRAALSRSYALAGNITILSTALLLLVDHYREVVEGTSTKKMSIEVVHEEEAFVHLRAHSLLSTTPKFLDSYDYSSCPR